MKIKELNNLNQKFYEILTENKEIAEALSLNDKVFLYEVSENNKHEVFVLNSELQLSTALKENGFTNNVIINKLIINKQTKSVHGAF